MAVDALELARLPDDAPAPVADDAVAVGAGADHSGSAALALAHTPMPVWSHTPTIARPVYVSPHTPVPSVSTAPTKARPLTTSPHRPTPLVLIPTTARPCGLALAHSAGPLAVLSALTPALPASLDEG